MNKYLNKKTNLFNNDLIKKKTKIQIICKFKKISKHQKINLLKENGLNIQKIIKIYKIVIIEIIIIMIIVISINKL